MSTFKLKSAKEVLAMVQDNPSLASEAISYTKAKIKDLKKRKKNYRIKLWTTTLEGLQEIKQAYHIPSIKEHLGYTPMSLCDYIREHGGIQDHAGELKSRDITNKTRPGLIRNSNATIATAQGVKTIDNTIDYVKERVFDAGYFPGCNDYNEISDTMLYDAIANDAMGDRRYTQEDALQVYEYDNMVSNIDMELNSIPF